MANGTSKGGCSQTGASRPGSAPGRTANDDRSDVKNTNNDAHAADIKNREEQGHGNT